MFTLKELIELKTDFFKGKRVKLVRHKDSRTEYKDILKDREALLEYQKEQGKEVFKNTDYLISFIGQESTKSLLFGVFKVNGIDKKERGVIKKGEKFFYNLTEVNIIDELIDRVVIDWGKSAISWYQWYDKQTKEVIEILPKGYLGEFKGLTNFVLDYDELKKLISNPDANKDWKSNLSSINGIYMILDTKTGSQYIGSAYGIGGVWQRWSEYASSIHGDNKRLKELCKLDKNYKKNFQYTILESLPSNVNKKEVIKIENLYKEKFGTRAFGLNEN
jgi:hypothetical protein